MSTAPKAAEKSNNISLGPLSISVPQQVLTPEREAAHSRVGAAVVVLHQLPITFLKEAKIERGWK